MTTWVWNAAPATVPAAGEAAGPSDRRQRHRRRQSLRARHLRDDNTDPLERDPQRGVIENLGRRGWDAASPAPTAPRTGRAFASNTAPARPTTPPATTPCATTVSHDRHERHRRLRPRHDAGEQRHRPRLLVQGRLRRHSHVWPRQPGLDTRHDVTIRGNIIRDTLGNTDGTHPEFERLFSLAIYLDHYSRDMVVENNTVTGSTWTGALFQNSTGTFTGNTLYDNVASDWGSELSIVGGFLRPARAATSCFRLGAIDARSGSVTRPSSPPRTTTTSSAPSTTPRSPTIRPAAAT